MQERADNHEFRLYTKEKGWLYDLQVRGYESITGDYIVKDPDRNDYVTKKSENIVFYGYGIDEDGNKEFIYDYLNSLVTVYGTRPECRFYHRIKSDDRRDQRWKVISSPSLKISEITLTHETLEASVPTKEGGIIDDIETHFSDDFDILPNEAIDGTVLEPLKTVTLQMDARQILRRSKLEIAKDFDLDGNEIKKQLGNTAGEYVVPWNVKTNNDQHNIGPTDGRQIFNQPSEGFSTFLTRVSADSEYQIKGRLKLSKVSQGALNQSIFGVILVTYTGENQDYQSHVDIYGSSSVNFDAPDEVDFTFDETLFVPKDGSLAILIANISGKVYEYQDESAFQVIEEQLYPVTTTRAIKPFDLIERLTGIITGRNAAFKSSIFGPGGKYENQLLTVGNWLRNVPDIINEGEEDEKRTQIKASIRQIYELFGIREPLRYRAEFVGNEEFFCIETLKSSFLGFDAYDIGETKKDDEGNDDFEFYKLNKQERVPLGDNFFTKIKIGSTTSGENYGEVNNLYSTSGNGEWVTNNKSDEAIEYTAVTEVRTGAEDAEFTRQIQYVDFPETDTDRDNDMFVFDCKLEGNIYRLKKWADYYETIPTKVYSATTNYNWPYTPARLLLDGHSWYLNAGLYQYPTESIRLSDSNCNASLITKKAGEEAVEEGGRLKNIWFERPLFMPWTITGNTPFNQEIMDAIRAKTDDIENKYGLVRVKVSEGHLERFYLSQVQEGDSAEWELIPAI